MEMDSLISVLESLKENSESFFTKDGDDAIWRKDVEALNQIIPILTVCNLRGIRTAVELAAAFEEQEKLKERPAKRYKQRFCDYWGCPSCRHYIAKGDPHCRNCGQRIGWAAIQTDGGNSE